MNFDVEEIRRNMLKKKQNVQQEYKSCTDPERKKRLGRQYSYVFSKSLGPDFFWTTGGSLIRTGQRTGQKPFFLQNWIGQATIFLCFLGQVRIFLGFFRFLFIFNSIL